MHPLIEELKRRQGDKSYRKYAEELNISTPSLFHVLERGRSAGVTVLAAIAVHFPDMGELILEYLKDKHNEKGEVNLE